MADCGGRFFYNLHVQSVKDGGAYMALYGGFIWKIFGCPPWFSFDDSRRSSIIPSFPFHG